MKTLHVRSPSSAVVSLLAALTTWVALWAWAGFVERPSGFLLPTLGACLLIAVAGMLMRSARMPSVLVALGQLAVLAVWLTRAWAEEQNLGGWIPTPESLREVASRFGESLTAAQAYAAPVPETVPEIYPLLVVAGAATALLVDFLACGIRQVPLAGLPLLAVYTAPVSILDQGVPWWGFAAGALTFLFLISSDQAQRLSHWGRQIPEGSRMFDSLDTTVSTQALQSSARKIGLTATGLAVVIPIFIPTFGVGLFSGSGSGSGGDGDVVSISNPMVDLKRDLVRGDDVDLVWVTTPDTDPSYLRISVLDSFDGETWKPSGRDIPVEQRAEGKLPRPPGLEPEVPWNEVPYSIEISSDFESKWLPTPYPLASIEARGDWRYDVSTFDFISAAEGQSAENMDYSLRALKIRPTAESLAAAGPSSDDIFTPYTALPESMPESVRRQARALTDDRASRFEKAVRLQEWFREDGGFTYSLERDPGNGIADLERFLGDGPNSRVGYCEQFAAAMAVMSRSIGIPARVAVGFLRPERVEDNTYVYSAHDLHAWPELFFEGTGWVRFEPTPPDRAISVPGYTDQLLPTDDPSAGPSAGSPTQSNNRIDRESLPPGVTAGTGGTGTTGDANNTRNALLVILVLLGLAAVPRVTRSMVRRRRWSTAATPTAVAEAAWSELRDSSLDLGVPWDDTVTLRTRARTLVQSFGEPDLDGDDRLTRSPLKGPAADPGATHALERLVNSLEKARYARSVDAVPGVKDDVDLCVAALRNGASKKARMRAKWLPVSLIRWLGTLMRGESDLDDAGLSEAGVDHAV